MARILSFPVERKSQCKRPASGGAGNGSAEILIFPGIRVEYHDGTETVDLSRRIRTSRTGNEKKAAF